MDAVGYTMLKKYLPHRLSLKCTRQKLCETNNKFCVEHKDRCNYIFHDAIGKT